MMQSSKTKHAVRSHMLSFRDLAFNSEIKDAKKDSLAGDLGISAAPVLLAVGHRRGDCLS